MESMQGTEKSQPTMPTTIIYTSKTPKTNNFLKIIKKIV
jgi:hypothetical protein